MNSADGFHIRGRSRADELTAHPLAPIARWRVRRAARARAVRCFSQLHPYWYESRFDEAFVSRLPQGLLDVRHAEAVAREWSRQFRYAEERQRERDVRQVTPVVESFLALLADAEGRSAARASDTSAPSRSSRGGARDRDGDVRRRSGEAGRPEGSLSRGHAPERIEKDLRGAWGRHVLRSVAWASFRIRVRLRAPGIDAASWPTGAVGAGGRRREGASEIPPSAPAPPAPSAAPDGAARP